jgi:hypothetical protein
MFHPFIQQNHVHSSLNKASGGRDCKDSQISSINLG